MANIKTIDHEANNFTEWSGTFGTEPQLGTGTAALNGTYGMYCNRASTNEYKLTDYESDANAHRFFSFLLKIRTAPSAATGVVTISKNSGASPVAIIRVNTDRTLQLRNASADIGSPTLALDLNTIYKVELEVDMTPSTGSCIVRARLEQVQFAESLVETKSSYGRLLAGVGSGATSKDIVMDYFRIDDAEYPYGDLPPSGGGGMRASRVQGLQSLQNIKSF